MILAGLGVVGALHGQSFLCFQPLYCKTSTLMQWKKTSKLTRLNYPVLNHRPFRSWAVRLLLLLLLLKKCMNTGLDACKGGVERVSFKLVKQTFRKIVVPLQPHRQWHTFYIL